VAFGPFFDDHTLEAHSSNVLGQTDRPMSFKPDTLVQEHPLWIRGPGIHPHPHAMQVGVLSLEFLCMPSANQRRDSCRETVSISPEIDRGSCINKTASTMHLPFQNQGPVSS
jgi:hypothetical protein